MNGGRENLDTNRCAKCNHVHAGPSFSSICIGCPCPERPNEVEANISGTQATLVERLRNDWGKGYGDMSKVSLEAADALEAKDAEIERLRGIIAQIQTACSDHFERHVVRIGESVTSRLFNEIYLLIKNEDCTDAE